MTELTLLCLLTAVEIAALLIAARQAAVYREPARLRMYIGVNLIMVIVLGSYLVEVGGIVTNVAGVFYGGALLGVIVTIERYGSKTGEKLIRAIWSAMALTFLLIQVTVLMPVVPGNEPQAAAIQLIGGHNSVLIIASFAAVTATILTVIKLYRWLRLSWGAVPTALAAVVVGQAVDSVVFYPLAFWDQGVEWVLIAGLSGLALKITVGLAGLPAVAAVRYSRCFRLRHHDGLRSGSRIHHGT